MKKIAFLLMIVMAISLFAGCAKSADTVTLNVLNWGDYIDEELITRFEDETGIKINYTTLANNEEMLVKLQQEDCIYDLCFPSDYIIEKLIGMDLLHEINKDNIPNLKNIDPRFMDLDFDPDNKYLTRLSRREWLVDGRFSCDDAIELGWPLEESDDYETIAGWILELCDSVPDIGEVFEVAGYKFKVQSMRGQRISLIRVIAPAETDKKDSESSAEKPAASGAGSADPHDGDE